jgi:hypothetical protein
MPDIHPAAGDLVEITIAAPFENERKIAVAQIKTKENDGWLIELAGDPPMRGKVNMHQYEWSSAAERWRKSPEKATDKAPNVARLSTHGRPTADAGR